MEAKSPSSIFASLTIHAFVAILIFLASVYLAKQDTPPVIFELVAGAPTAMGELEAPALGDPAAPLQLEIPKVEPTPVPQVRPQAVTPETAPEEKEVPAVKPTPKKPVETKPVPTKPKVDNSIANEMKKKSKVSYQDYLKKNPLPKPASTSAKKTAQVPRIDTKGIAAGVKNGSVSNTRGGEGGKALTREEQSQLNTYISFLLNALKEAHEPPAGVSDQMEAKVTFDITASGSILSPRISKSSGDKAFDESVIQAFRRVKSIGPTPDGKADTWTVTFRMKDME